MRIRHSTVRLGKASLPLLLLLLGIMVFPGCAEARTGAVAGGWSGGTVAEDTLFIGSMEGQLVAIDTADGSRLWSVSLTSPESAGGGFGCAPASASVVIYGTPAVAGDLVYIGGYIYQANVARGKVYAFINGRDETEWEYPRQGVLDGPIIGGLVAAHGKVYFGAADGKAYALEGSGGYTEWEFETGGEIWSTPAVDGNTLFVGSFDKKLYALDIADGSQKWEFETEGAIVATPLVYNDTVYIGSFDRYLYAVDANNGNLRWKFLAGNWFWAKPVIHNGIIYAGCLDGKVYALDAETGARLVAFDLGSPISSSTVLVDDLLIVAATNDKQAKVYSLDTVTNEKKLLADLDARVDAPLAASQGIIYVHTDKDGLYAVDARSGAKREFNLKP